MVQIIKERSFGSEFGRSLGTGLGEGFSQGVEESYKNKSKMAELQKENEDIYKATGIKLQGVTPETRKLEYSEKLKAQAKEKERGEELAGNKQVLRGLERQRGLQEGSLSDFESDPKAAELSTRTAKERAPPGGLGGIPMTPEEASAKAKIIRENREASAEELEIKFDEAGIKPGHYKDVLESRRRQDEQKIKRHSEASDKILQNAEEKAATLIQKETSLNLQDQALASKDLSYFSRDNLAELTGIEGFRSPEGAVYKTAGKEYFLGNISRAGARPNMWIEQQISDMMSKVGRSTEANLSVNRALRNELDIDKEEVRLIETISKRLEDQLGYIPRDLGSRVNKELKVYAEDKQKELFNDLRAIKSIGEKIDQKFEKVKEGTPVSKFVAQALLDKFDNDPKRASEEAKRLGYTF